MGGGEHLLHLADRQWEAVTRQLTRLGTVSKEYGIREDQMHQAESDVCLLSLVLGPTPTPLGVSNGPAVLPAFTSTKIPKRKTTTPITRSCARVSTVATAPISLR